MLPGIWAAGAAVGVAVGLPSSPTLLAGGGAAFVLRPGVVMRWSWRPSRWSGRAPQWPQRHLLQPCPQWRPRQRQRRPHPRRPQRRRLRRSRLRRQRRPSEARGCAGTRRCQRPSCVLDGACGPMLAGFGGRSSAVCRRMHRGIWRPCSSAWRRGFRRVPRSAHVCGRPSTAIVTCSSTCSARGPSSHQ